VNTHAAPLTDERSSGLLDAIYDCAIAPERWPHAMEMICAELDCSSSAIIVADLKQYRVEPLAGWNNEVFSGEDLERYFDNVVSMFSVEGLGRALDEPIILSRQNDPASYPRLPNCERTVKPVGIHDIIATMAWREPNRIGAMTAHRRKEAGVATDREIAIMRLLAPHIRRAMAISNRMDHVALFNQSLGASLDSFDVGVIAVDAEGLILHANAEARAMFAAGMPVMSRHDRLSALPQDAASELSKAVTCAHRGDLVIGVPLLGPEGAPAIAHVLPLKHRKDCPHFGPRATAAVFVSMADQTRSVNFEAFARHHNISAAETRVLERVIMGSTVAQIGLALNISKDTVKTHLKQIFSKTGVRGQAELIKMVNGLAPRVSRRGCRQT
jgi:DNA-binding CsgD family transcriptional regulator/PAS domain-containing protein